MSQLTDEEFLKKRVNIVFEPLVTSMLVEKPKDPVLILIKININIYKIRFLI
jgi:hypothetical protein